MSTFGIYIIGTTASGKSQLALDVAEKIGAEIINADSIAFFDKLDIGSAKPSSEDQVRVKHHLIGIKALGSEYTAGEFRRDVETVLTSSSSRNFVVAGGSGFYIQAIDRGMFDAHPGDAKLRAQLESRADKEGVQVLYAELQAQDPEGAARISMQDRYRVIRALEIINSDPERRSLSLIRAQFQEQKANPVFFRSIKVGLRLPPAELTRRIHARTEAMLHNGLVTEVENILKSVPADWRPLQSVGYREVVEMLEGKIRREELLERICLRTNQLAKKQRTWFQRDASIQWFEDSNQASAFILQQSAKEN